jgi:hypothetical protein
MKNNGAKFPNDKIFPGRGNLLQSRKDIRTVKKRYVKVVQINTIVIQIRLNNDNRN